jgi:hypothetical protein
VVKITNSDFWILAGILSVIGGLGIYEGYAFQSALYTQPVIIFGGLGYMGFKTLYLERRKEDESSINSKGLHSG